MVPAPHISKPYITEVVLFIRRWMKLSESNNIGFLNDSNDVITEYFLHIYPVV